MSPEYVRPYVKAQKNDDLDAEAIAEAASRPTMRFVEVKSQAQSDIQALHRARERLVSERTALINHLRALLLERGIVAAQGRRKLEEALSTFADEGGIEALSPRIRVLIEDLRSEWRALDERIARRRDHPRPGRVRTQPGFTFQDGFKIIAGPAPVPTSATGSLLFDRGAGSLFWDADGTDGQVAVLLTHIAGFQRLAANDVLLI